MSNMFNCWFQAYYKNTLVAQGGMGFCVNYTLTELKTNDLYLQQTIDKIHNTVVEKISESSGIPIDSTAVCILEMLN